VGGELVITMMMVDWNRPMWVVFMVCMTVLACFVIANLHKWFK